MRLMNLMLVSITLPGLALTSCNMLPLGPDLASTPTPFGGASVIRLIMNDPETPPIEIRHTDAGDRAILPVSPLSKDKPFNATITYYAFTPDTGDHKDYWLAGANVFQTVDRSSYAVIRYPHGTTFKTGSTTPAEMLILSCTMRGVEPPLAKPVQTEATEIDEPTMAPSVPDDKVCDFASRDELYTFLPGVIRAAANEAERNKRKDENSPSSDYEWQVVRIVIP